MLKAGGNVTIASGENTFDESHYSAEKKSGLMSSGGIGFSIGTLQQSRGDVSSSTQAVSSVVGSTDGNLSIIAGKDYTQIGSYVIAPKGDLTISAQQVEIREAQNSSSSSSESQVKQTGLTVALTSPVLSAIQTAGQMKSAASQTSDGRMQALAGAVTALSAKNAYDAVSSNPSQAGGVNVSVSMGVSKSDSKTMQTSTTAVGSVVSAGGNVSIQATGAGNESDVIIQGSTVKAGGNVTLKADDEIRLLAAKNTAEQHSTNTSSSASVGVSVGTSGLLFTVSASGARGNADGSDVTWTNTHVDAGNTLTLQSGGDTTLKGAVATGANVVALAGGDLHIESLQDTSVYDSKQKSLGGSVSAGPGVISGSINVSNSKIQSDYASVTEQSGIKAGDKGFQVSVAGNTSLIGAVIASTDAAATAGNNALSTAMLTQTALQNKANYSAQSVSLGGGYSTGGGGVGKDQKGNAESGGNQTPGSTLPSLSGFSATTPVAMAASGNASSVTQSGISGGVVTITDSAAQLALTGKTTDQTIGEVKRDVVTGTDGSNSLKPIFNEKEIQAGFAVVGALTREVGTFIDNRAKEVDAKKVAADNAEKAASDPNTQLSDDARLALLDQAIALRKEAQRISADWGAGGTYRQITTALVAAAGGNVTGSTDAMVQSMVVNYVQQQGAGYIGQLVANGSLIEGSPEHAALHAILACAGSAASGADCASGAGGAAVSSLLTGLFSETSPDETQAQREAKRNLITSLVGGIAATTGSNAAAATSAGIAATDNNWLATQQIVQARKELANASGLLAQLQVAAKWIGISQKQDVLTSMGVGKGLAAAGWSDLTGIASFLAHPVDGLNGLKQLISDTNKVSALGASVVKELNDKIDRIADALTQGGDQKAEQLGKDLGDLLYQVGSVVTGVGQVAKGGAALAKIGVVVGSDGLKAMAAKSARVISDIKIASALPGAAKSVEELSASTSSGYKSAYSVKPSTRPLSDSQQTVAAAKNQIDTTSGTSAVGRSIAYENPSIFVQSRVDELLSQIPLNSQGRITMGVAVVEDANGVRSTLISTSEPRGYLRPGVTTNPGEVVVVGTGHAEADIVSYAKDNGLKIIDIGASRPVCPTCHSVIIPTDANITTPLKPVRNPKSSL